ncbi:MAG: putative malate transporter [Clostridia bacterium]|nr:putative malate transporter [Clostridia bacterium]
MTSFFTTLNVVLPICFMVGLGTFLRSRGILNDVGCKILNNLAFFIFLPSMIFKNIYGASIGEGVYGKLLGFAGICLAGSFLILMLLVSKMEKTPEKRGVMVQGSIHNSFLIIGMSLAANLYPDMDYTVLAILATLAIPMNHITSILSLQFFHNRKSNLKQILTLVIRNPVLIGCAAAIILNAVKIPVPKVLLSTVSSLSSPAIPICLLALGGNFKFSSFRTDYKQVLFSSGVKLILLPLIFVPLAVFAGFKGMPLLALLVFFGSPTAPVTYTLAASMDGDTDLASKIVLFSNCLAVITLFCFIYILLSLGLL